MFCWCWYQIHICWVCRHRFVALLRNRIRHDSNIMFFGNLHQDAQECVGKSEVILDSTGIIFFKNLVVRSAQNANTASVRVIKLKVQVMRFYTQQITPKAKKCWLLFRPKSFYNETCCKIIVIRIFLMLYFSSSFSMIL